MRIALYWNNPYPLAATTVRHDLYAEGFERLGHEVVTACLSVAAANVKGRVVTFDAPDEPRHVAFWERLRPDLLVVVTWLNLYEELACARQAGASVIAISDSDGQVGFGGHRRHQLYRSVMQHSGLRDRVAAVKYFGQRLLNRQEESAQIVRSIEVSDSVLVNTAVAATNIAIFLGESGRSDLIARISVCPYPVDPRYLESPVAGKRPARMVAVGRWDSMQKDAALLRDALTCYYEAGGRTDTHIYGAGIDVFQTLSARYPAVVCHGVAAVEDIAESMRNAQALLLTSRWESGPIVAFEALCQGCTLVSTDIPNMRELIAGERFGALATARSPHSVATAIAREDERWRAGTRHANAIAEHWRPVFATSAVCERVLDSLTARETCLVPPREAAAAP